jgi:hypothetical protein
MTIHDSGQIPASSEGRFFMKKLFLIAIALSSVVVPCLALQKEADLAASFREYIQKVHVEDGIRAERREITQELKDIHNQPYLDEGLRDRRASLESELVLNSIAL